MHVRNGPGGEQLAAQVSGIILRLRPLQCPPWSVAPCGRDRNRHGKSGGVNESRRSSNRWIPQERRERSESDACRAWTGSFCFFELPLVLCPVKFSSINPAKR